MQKNSTPLMALGTLQIKDVNVKFSFNLHLVRAISDKKLEWENHLQRVSKLEPVVTDDAAIVIGFISKVLSATSAALRSVSREIGASMDCTDAVKCCITNSNANEIKVFYSTDCLSGRSFGSAAATCSCLELENIEDR
ncbi:hypothetical protein CEXT_318001 [Caerostris extrusa]|uniref:Uncharacterized protein n=1 Tax=Caerostris extrusa TaxID=172846 RepID=A0AAV4MIM5_CAEEX|nr:hypothetical protein CEXT_318001 [Caerostris extrusa]